MAAQVTWPDQETLAANKQRLLAKLRQRIEAYELRYEMPSHRLQEALDTGRLHETHEVCRWVVAYSAYQALWNGSNGG